ncbi:NADH-quinone oxidoreductase subunit C [uncultured Desulfovibrio sp.]|uniref:hydrogenase large subunit n=1 Tax=uncultured Desulfovibrio sp. TaxID=167968 RepID=UPI00266F7D14|nr:NADH-quinone oxidoreductase subunit C [uncultured Desulfovibrio sp.]
MLFDYRDTVPLKGMPPVSVEELGDTVRRRLAEGWRLLVLCGLPDADAPRDKPEEVTLCCVLAQDSSHYLEALRTPPLRSFPSLASVCPQAQLFEREIWEQWGVEPLGHPWLKPARRIPDAAEAAARTQREGGPCAAQATPAAAPYPFFRVKGEEIHEVAVGPVHAGVIEPGHFRFQCYGENVLHLEIALGYQHRGLERLVLEGPPHCRLPLLECAAGDTSVGHATAHCVLLERLAGSVAAPRAQRLRRIGLELERLANHVGDLGAIAGDTGFLPTSSWNGRIRGDFLNLTASLCGNRFGRGLLRPGGSGHDLDPEQCADLLARVREAGRDARGAVDVMLHSQSVLDRLTGTGALTTATARELDLTGPAARACGLALDARFHFPLADLPTAGCAPRVAQGGDVLARTLVRSAELDDSLRLLELDLSALANMPGCAAAPATEPLAPLPPDTLAVAQVEGWRGEICHLAVTGPDGGLRVYKVVDPSFRNWPGLAVALRGNQISDFPLCNKSFNLSYCGHDL